MPVSPVSEKCTTTSLAGFAQYVTELKPIMKRQYERSVNRDLSRQNWQGLFKRNVTSVLKQAYEDSLVQLQSVSFAADAVETGEGFSKVAFQALKVFDGFTEELVQYALQKPRTSCALSNFPDEPRPSEDYIAEVIQETSKDWQAFALRVNACITGVTPSH